MTTERRIEADLEGSAASGRQHAGRLPENADPEEVARFAALAKSWWDPDGALRPLHRIGPARLSFVRDVLTDTFGRDGRALRPLSGLRILDVGCGGGLIAEPMARLGATVTGIDLAGDSIAAARAHAASSGLTIDYKVESLERMAEDGARFDAVLCLEVIEHVPEPGRMIATISRVVEPGGLAILSTINRTSRSYALAIVAAEYVLRWLPRGTHDWNRFVTPQELEGFVAAAGLETLRHEGLVYDPLTDAWSRRPDTAVNYITATRKPAPTAG
ncbi:MAG: bifunctional 2-polyprenyl-6-hydroxyphenol methylase/3-demethylubiquinol 3-O-methyltransferase UbiG [Hyphomicrobiaceae bacterium]